MTKQQPAQQDRPRAVMTLAYARKAAAVLSAVAYVAAVAGLVVVKLVPLKYLLVLVLLTAIGMAVLLRAQLRKQLSRAKSVASIVLSLLISLICAGVLATTATLHGFLSEVQQAEYSTETYSIVAKKDRQITLASASTAALLGSDQYLEQVQAELGARTPAAPTSHPNLAAIVAAVDDKKTDTAVLSSAYMSVLHDNSLAFYDSIEVLATFTIRVKSTQRSQIDVTKPFVVYISGIDTHGKIGTVARSDVNMLVVVNPQSNEILLVNTPRDYYVQLHGTTGTKDKLTHAGLYGVDMSRQTLEDLYDTKIGAYIRVNFDSLVEIVDALGGVEVYSDYAFKSFRVGYNHMDGQAALAFARERYSFAEGDRQRGRNQQRVIEAIISKMNNLRNLLRYQAILHAVQGAIQTNIGEENLAKLANHQLDTLRGWSVESISVDGSGAMSPTYSMGAQPLYVMVPDQQTVATAKQKIADVLGSR